MLRSAKKKDTDSNEIGAMMTTGTGASTTSYRHHAFATSNNNNSHPVGTGSGVGGSTSNDGSFVSTEVPTFAALSLSSRSLSDGSSNSTSSRGAGSSRNINTKDTTLISSSAMTSCLPPAILTRSIPDGDDNKYGYKSHTSAWKKACGCYSDNSPRPVMNRACSRGSANKNLESSSLLQQRFMIFISVLAFIRVSNTFYMYKTSLDQVMQGRDPSNMSYGARHLTSLINTNAVMMYYQGNNPFESMYHATPPSKAKKPSVTYDDLLEEYNIPSLTVLPYDISMAIRQESFDPWRLVNDDEVHTRIHTMKSTYREQRQQRTRPPSISGASTDNDAWTVVETFSTTERQSVGKETMIDIASGNDNDRSATPTNVPYNWKELCTQANLSKTSRVIITNALSVSIGSPLTLLLAKQCGVKNIMIVDSMFPNTKRRRLIMMDTYRTLFRNVLTLQLTNPTNTAGFGKVGSESPTDWMEKFEPSHIIHLEDLDGVLDSENHWGEYMSSKGQQLMHLQSSMLPMQQTMQYVHHKEKTNKMNILHVSLSSILSDPTAATNVDDENYNSNGVEHLHKTSVTHDVNAMMADYLHTMQQFRTSMIDESNMLQMHHLKLPNVYGPIMNGKLNDRNKMMHDNGNSLYLDDAMVGVFKALHISQNENRQIMSIPSSQVRESNSAWRQDLTHAYEMQVEYPFGGIESDHYLSKITSLDTKAYKDAMTWVNDLYGVNKSRFPCASSCVADTSDTTTCDASIWDSVYPVSQSMTEQCTNVMYYVNLDPKLETLVGPATDTVPSTSNDICRIAFVSGSSTLATEALQQGREASNEKNWNDAEALQQYNGKLIKDGWTLVWMSDTKVSESDRSLIRIDPSRFFASTVQKAIYVEADRIMTLSNDEVMDTILSNTVHDAHTETYYTTELREGYDDLYRSIEHPPSHARAVTFLASELPSEIRPNNPAQYMELLSNRVPNVKGRHLNYYKQMNHYIQVDMNRPVEDSDGTSPFVWISRDYFVHNLRTNEGHTFRCQWYDAHMYWGPETIVADSEELSLAYVIAKQRVEGRIGFPLLDDPTWYPQLNPYTGEPLVSVDDQPSTTTETFMRVMKGESIVVVEEEEEISQQVEGESNNGNEGESK
jgi:hypothetical protein